MTEGKAEGKAEVECVKIAPGDPEGAPSTTAEALDEIKEQEKLLLVAKNKHKSITKEFQKLAKKMGLVDTSTGHHHKRKREDTKESKSHKSHKGGSKDQRQVHQVKEYVREKLKKFYVDKKITKDQFKVIVAKMWAKLQDHKNLGQKDFLTRDRKDKIKKMVDAYVKMKDKLSSA